MSKLYNYYKTSRPLRERVPIQILFDNFDIEKYYETKSPEMIQQESEFVEHYLKYIKGDNSFTNDYTNTAYAPHSRM